MKQHNDGGGLARGKGKIHRRVYYRYFRCLLQCQINMNLVPHISEDGSEMQLKHCAFSKTSVKSLPNMFRALKLDKTRHQSHLAR